MVIGRWWGGGGGGGRIFQVAIFGQKKRVILLICGQALENKFHILDKELQWDVS